MKLSFLPIILLFTILIASCQSQAIGGVGSMKISSSAFNHNTMIPSKFTCQGDDINPELLINELPDGTKSLVLIMDDPDAPGGIWDHWVVYDMPVTTRIDENSAPETQGKNSWGRNDYGGPCPPLGTHRYFFKVYALDEKLNLPPGQSKKAVESAIKGHVLDQAELIGLYKKD